MQRTIGTVSRGVRAPIIRQGDDIAQIVIDSVLDAVKAENITLHDRDVIAVTEAVYGEKQGCVYFGSDACCSGTDLGTGFPGDPDGH